MKYCEIHCSVYRCTLQQSAIPCSAGEVRCSALYHEVRWSTGLAMTCSEYSAVEYKAAVLQCNGVVVVQCSGCRAGKFRAVVQFHALLNSVWSSGVA